MDQGSSSTQNLDPRPVPLNPQTSTLNPLTPSHNPQLYTKNPTLETGRPLNPKPGTVRQVPPGNKCFYFQNLHENYHTKPSGRDQCVVIFLAKFSKGRYSVPNFLTTDREIVLQVMIDMGEDGKAERASSSVSWFGSRTSSSETHSLVLPALANTIWF